MAYKPPLESEKRVVGRCVAVGVVALLLAVGAMAWAAFAPLAVQDPSVRAAGAKHLRPLPVPGQDLRALLVTMAGRRLIKPAQAQAAVKDSGAAERLLKQLKLQGVVQTGADLVAYIHVTKEGTKRVRAGEKVLDFVVARIEPGKVTLTLQGVEVVLGH